MRAALVALLFAPVAAAVAAPAGETGDRGFGVTLRRTGRPAFVCAGDNIVDTTAPVLRVGRTWSNGGITCASQQAGLRCSNAAGHGFVASPTRWRLF